MPRRVLIVLLLCLCAAGCATSGDGGARRPEPKVAQPFTEISDDTVALLLRLFSLEPEIRENMYDGQPLPFDREKIRDEFFTYVANAEMDEGDRRQLYMVLAYIFSDRLLSEREEAIMRDFVTYFRAVAVRMPQHERLQVEKIVKVTEARLALDVQDRERRR